MPGLWRERLVKILEAQAQRGRSLREISKAAGLGPNYLQQMISTGKEPSISNLMAICSAVGVSIGELLDDGEVDAARREIMDLALDLPEDRLEALLQFAQTLRKL